MTTSSTFNERELAKFDFILQTEGKPATTRRAYLSDLHQFFEWCNGTMDPLGGERYAVAFLNEQRKVLSPSAVGRRASALRKYFKTCDPKSTGMLDNWKAPTPAPGKAHPLPNGLDDVRAMLRHEANPEVSAALGLLGLAGLRVSEARALRPCDIEWPDWIVVSGKGGKTRRVPMSEELCTILEVVIKVEGLANDEPFVAMSDSGIRRAITNAGERAGVSRRVSSHDLRMTFGTSVYEKTKDLRVVQELLGHASSSTTERYTGVSEAAMRAAVKETMS